MSVSGPKISSSADTEPTMASTVTVATLAENDTTLGEYALSDFTNQTDLALAYLSSNTKLEHLHSSLLHSLSACGWSERVRNLTFEILRSGHSVHFDDLFDTIVRLATTPKPPGENNTDENGKENGNSVLGKRKRAKETNGTKAAATNGTGHVGPNVKEENASDAEEDAEAEPDIETKPDLPPPSKRQKNANISNNFNHTGATDTKTNGETQSQEPLPASTTTSTTITSDLEELFHRPEYDIRIPSNIVSRGVKLVSEALEDIIVPASATDGENGKGGEVRVEIKSKKVDGHSAQSYRDTPLKEKNAKKE